jgi:hypothetical protein
MRTKPLLSVAALVFSLLLGETAFRLTGRFQPPPYPPVCVRPDLFQEFQPHGYRLWPSRTKQWFYPKGSRRKLTLASNSDGFRSSRDLNGRDERIRVIVLGDSLVFGPGVEESERFTDVLEAMQPNWRVDNLGMPGYGPDLMLRALEAAGLKSHPHVVVFSLYTDDFQRVRPQHAGVGFEIPRFTLSSGQLVTIPYPKPDLWDRLNIVVALRTMYWRYTSALFRLNEAILDRFLKLAAAHGFVPVVTFLPGTSDTPDDQARRAWLRQYAERYRIAFLDLTGPIHRAGPGAFLPQDPHLSAKGHQIVALEMQRFLARQGLSRLPE